MWLRVIVVAANIAGWSPSVAVMATAIAVQTIADTARQLQIRRRTNNYLDRVNEEIFKPRGQYAMIMKFSDKPPRGARKATAATTAEKLGEYFVTEQVNFLDGDAKTENSGPAQPTNEGSGRPEFNAAATISKYTHTQDRPDMNKFQKRMKGYREYSDQTHGEIQLPDSAPLIFPDIDRAAIRVRDGIAPKSTFQSGRTWVRDYIDRKEQIGFVSIVTRFSKTELTRNRKHAIKDLPSLSLKRDEKRSPRDTMTLTTPLTTENFSQLSLEGCSTPGHVCLAAQRLPTWRIKRRSGLLKVSRLARTGPTNCFARRWRVFVE